MASMPAASAICASRILSSKVFCQRSGTVVAARPLEQLEPKTASLNRLPPTMVGLRSTSITSLSLPRFAHLSRLKACTSGRPCWPYSIPAWPACPVPATVVRCRVPPGSGLHWRDCTPHGCRCRPDTHRQYPRRPGLVDILALPIHRRCERGNCCGKGLFGFFTSLNVSDFVVRQICWRRGASPRRGRADHLQRCEPLRGLLG